MHAGSPPERSAQYRTPVGRTWLGSCESSAARFGAAHSSLLRAGQRTSGEPQEDFLKAWRPAGELEHRNRPFRSDGSDHRWRRPRDLEPIVTDEARLDPIRPERIE